MAEDRIVACTRCARADAPALARPPLPGAFGRELHSRVCADCYRDWQRMEVMVINELRLNFMDPKAQEILDQQMRRFFLLDGETDVQGIGPGGPGSPAPGAEGA